MRIVIAMVLAGLTLPAIAHPKELTRIHVTRKTEDLYQVVGSKKLIKTRECAEYFNDDAILVIDLPDGSHAIGWLIFLGQQKFCLVDAVVEAD